MQRFDVEAAEAYVLKWWRSSETGQLELHSIAHAPHSAEVTVVLAHPHNPHCFISASLDGSFKCWDLPVASPGSAERPSWQCTAVGSWDSRPILSAALSEDGSTLALGYAGYAVLWEPWSAVQLQALPLEEAPAVVNTAKASSSAVNGASSSSPRGGTVQRKANQLCFSIACNRFLLVVGAHCPDHREDIFVWDLASLQVVARVNVTEALGSRGPCVMRVFPPLEPGGALRLLAFKAPGKKSASQRPAPGIRLWRIGAVSAAEPSALGAELLVKATMPSSQGILDALFLAAAKGAPDALNIRIWTSSFELWDVDFSGSLDAAEQPAVGDDAEAAAARTKLARLLGESTATKVAARTTTASAAAAATAPAAAAGAMASGSGAASAAALPLSPLPLRETPEQQAGIVPRLVERVVPPHVPSHMLPPPAAIWSSFLTVFGKAAPDSGSVEELAAEPTATYAKATTAGASNPGGAGASASSREAPERKAELVDADFMDELVERAFR